jgi:hypothetical protein
MLLIGLENSRSPHQCFFSAFTSDAPPYNTLLPRELAERSSMSGHYEEADWARAAMSTSGPAPGVWIFFVNVTT